MPQPNPDAAPDAGQPDGTLTLAVAGLIDHVEAERAIAVLRTVDPQLRASALLAEGLLTIHSARSPAVFCAALEVAGFAAAPTARRPRRFTFDRVAPVVGRAVLFALLWIIPGGIIGIGAAILNMQVNPQCGAGDSGGCAMAIPAIAVMFAILAAVLAALVTLMRGIRRLARGP